MKWIQLQKRLFIKKLELELYNDKKLNGYILRGRAVHIESNEKNTSYFANLEKSRAEKKTICKLKVNNKYIYGSGEILREQVTYF